MSAAAEVSVLIVDDEPIVAHDLKDSLRGMGYDAFAIAASAEEALACAARRRPDVVLMDIGIQGADDGIQAAAHLKRKLPVIVIYLTAQADDAILNRAKCSEPAGYLVKPVQLAELHGMIEIALHRRQLEAEREKLRALQQRQFTITDNVPVAIAYFDAKGRVRFANRGFRRLATPGGGHDGPSAMSFLGEDLYKACYVPRQLAMLGERAGFVKELAVDGVRRLHEFTFLPDRDPSGVVAGVYALASDVTEREALRADLDQARADLQAILNSVPANITAWHSDLTNRFANDAARAQCPLLQGAAAGQHLRDVVGAEQFDQAWPAIEHALSGHATVHELDGVDPDGGVRHTRHHYVPERREGGVIGFYDLAFDITELRRSHDQILRLAQRLESVRMDERQEIAHILHDGIAQDLFAVKLDIDCIKSRIRRDKDLTRLCREAAAGIGKCMEDARAVVNEFRPAAMVRRSSLLAVIREHARHFAQRSHLIIRVEQSPGFPGLDEPTQMLLFRAAQEALTNVARHARASAVDIELGSNGAQISISICDDGIGFVEASLDKPHSLGLLGLRERFAAQGGGMSVARRPPHGTALTLYLPMPAADGRIGLTMAEPRARLAEPVELQTAPPMLEMH